MDSVIAFGARLLRWSADIDVHGHHSLRVASELLVTEVKAAHGEYRAGYNWPALATETVARKRTGDSPLLETGELRDSYGYGFLDHLTAEVGTDNPKALWMELGTAHVPPRPALGTAARLKEPEIVKLLGGGAVKALEIKR